MTIKNTFKKQKLKNMKSKPMKQQNVQYSTVYKGLNISPQ